MVEDRGRRLPEMEQAVTVAGIAFHTSFYSAPPVHSGDVDRSVIK